MNKDEFVEAIEASRELIRSGKHSGGTCSNVQCEWHGKCFECVMIHRVKRNHVPQCLQPILRDKIKDLGRMVELATVDARPSKAFWDHLLEVSPPAKQHPRRKRPNS